MKCIVLEFASLPKKAEVLITYYNVDRVDKCILEIHCFEPKRAHMDNGGRRGC